MTSSDNHRKDFETWINEGHNSNPRMLKREPEDKDSYDTSSVQLAWECYQNFVVEPDETKVLTVISTKDNSTSPKIVKITEAKDLTWYKVHYYSHGTQFNGQIGMLVKMFDKEEGDSYQTNSLVTPTGLILSNPEFVLQELESVDISYK
jgi:hypothetical protein